MKLKIGTCDLTLHVYEEIINSLDKHGVKTGADISLILDRMVNMWTSSHARNWAMFPAQIPHLKKIQEKKTMSIRINPFHAELYQNTIKNLNYKLGIDIDETALTSWILDEFYIKKFKIKYYNQAYAGQEWGNKYAGVGFSGLHRGGFL